MKQKFLTAAIVLFMSAGSALAQNKSSNYKTALGVKFYPGAITIKHFVKPNAALEGLLYLYNHGTRVTGLYEFHFDIPNASGLQWYVGPGAHIGFYNTKYFGGGTSVGIDGVIGLDYKFSGVPINLSLDWQPSFEFGNNFNGFGGSWGGLGIRYVIK